MPTKYKRKGNVRRGEWTTEQLSAAISAMDRGEMGIRQASREFGVPEGTLRRRRKNKDVQPKNLGPSCILGAHNEAKIVAHIKKLQKHGFAPTRSFVRSMAFELAQKLNLPHNFNKESRKAGYPWLESFLRRNKELTIRKSEGVSAARSLAMTRENESILSSAVHLISSTTSDDGSASNYNSEPSTSSATDYCQEMEIKREEPLISLEPSASSLADDYQEMLIKVEEPSLSSGDADYIKLEPPDPLSETEASLNVSSNTKSGSSEDKMYCRLCFRLADKFATPLGDVDVNYTGNNPAVRKKKLEAIQEVQKMIDVCLPFYNPLTLDPIICSTCLINLKKSYNFAVKCSDNQRKIEEYINIRGTSEKVNIKDVIESKFLTSTVKTNITMPTISNAAPKKNKGKRHILTNRDVDAPLVKKQILHDEPRNINVNLYKDIRIKVEPKRDNNSNKAAPVRVYPSPKCKAKVDNIQPEQGHSGRNSPDLTTTELVDRGHVCEFEKKEIDTRVREGNNSHTQFREKNNPVVHSKLPPECRRPDI